MVIGNIEYIIYMVCVIKDWRRIGMCFVCFMGDRC